MSIDDPTERNRERQTALYGEPLADLLGRAGERLGLNQVRLAGLLGLSAPMLSQLVTGRRIKIGNPQALQRLQALAALSDEADELSPDQIRQRLDEIAVAQPPMLTHATGTAQSTVPIAVRTVQNLLRAVASADDLLAAAQLLDAQHRDIADFLRIYGAGRTTQAVAHYRAFEDLV